MKVLHLPHGIGMSIYARALRAQGIEATACSYSVDPYSYLADECLNLNQYASKERKEIRRQYFNRAKNLYDVFHFHFGETFFSDKSDLGILAKAGKKMVAHHRGSEVRLLSVARGFNNPYVQTKSKWTEDKIVNNLKLLSAHIDQAIVSNDELVPYIEPYYKKIHVVPHAIEFEKFQPVYPTSDSVPLIVHAPSYRDMKGTEYVLSAIERLRNEETSFRFKLIEKLPHAEALNLYRQSTIVIDQLQIGAYGNLSIEAMAMGKPVICFIRDDLRSKYPPDLPIINANPDTLYGVLKKLLASPEQWGKIGRDGRRFVERHHSPDLIANMLIQIYRNL